MNAAPIMCPYCRTHAPLVYRGIHAYCAACGAPRTVLSGASLTHAGKPSRVGATVAKAFGAATLALGLFIALLLGLLISIASTTAGLIVGGSIAFFTIAAALLFRAGGKSLEKTGEKAQEAQRTQAVFALAQARGGRVQAADAARALQVTVEEADGLLTRLAKAQPETVGVDVGEQGEIFYVFKGTQAAGPLAGAPYGGGAYGTPASAPAHAWEPPRVRVDIPTDIWQPKKARVAPAAQPAGPAVVDVELEATEEAAAAARRRAGG
ncbi:MAG: hypothetical protein IPG04_27140 [Polyangiaceae bacterium]|nr:hypothetical protein [Polyangiaceae bacterium]